VFSQGTIRLAGIDASTMRPKAFPAMLLKELQVYE